MVKREIRSMHSKESNPPRLFDVIVDGEDIDLEIVTSKKKKETIPWNDVVLQVTAAKETEMSK